MDMDVDNMGKLGSKVHNGHTWPPVFTFPIVAAFLLAVTGTYGCGGSLNTGYANKTISYVSGLPSFDMEASPGFDGSRSRVDFIVSVPHSSLMFVRDGDRFAARYELSAALVSRPGNVLVADEAWRETTLVATYEATQDMGLSLVRHSIAVAPGSYTLILALDDLSSGKRAARSQEIDVLDLASGKPTFGPIGLETIGNNATRSPVISFFTHEKDSLDAVVHLYNCDPGRIVPMSAMMERFKTDTAVALPPFAYSLMGLPLGYGMLKSDAMDSTAVGTQNIIAVGSDITVRFTLPIVAKGLYRLTITGRVHGGLDMDDTLVTRSRLLSVQGPAFPKPVLLSEMVQSMSYILRDSEIQRFREAVTARERKRAFDSLWVSFTQDPEASAALLRRYYGRVEEANRMFTTTKEGWRTDPGMIYIVLGVPSEVARGFDTQTWYYNYSGGQEANTFSFKRVLTYVGDDLTFENYVLIRGGLYEMYWSRIVENWRSGRIF